MTHTEQQRSLHPLTHWGRCGQIQKFLAAASCPHQENCCEPHPPTHEEKNQSTSESKPLDWSLDTLQTNQQFGPYTLCNKSDNSVLTYFATNPKNLSVKNTQQLWIGIGIVIHSL
jgi:hypothetical protein